MNIKNNPDITMDEFRSQNTAKFAADFAAYRYKIANTAFQSSYSSCPGEWCSLQLKKVLLRPDR
jgi:hypothetical protein